MITVFYLYYCVVLILLFNLSLLYVCVIGHARVRIKDRCWKVCVSASVCDAAGVRSYIFYRLWYSSGIN